MGGASLQAPEGGVASFPCRTAPRGPQDRAVLVLWYKEGHRLPVFRWVKEYTNRIEVVTRRISLEK